ncbi:MAG: hypothetical protein IPP33_13420 [Flavobacteriales bacterium]|nr:hypothetical protein [Flavobacteriales bacterium]
MFEWNRENITVLILILTLLVYGFQGYWLRKQVRSYEQTERASVMLGELEMRDASAASKNKRVIHFAFKNYGRGPGIVTEFAHDTTLIPKEGKIPVPAEKNMHSVKKAYHPIESGGWFLSKDKDPSREGVVDPCAADEIQPGPVYDDIGKSKRLLFHGWIKYRSMSGGEYRRTFTCTWCHNHEGEGKGAFTIHTGEGCNVETRLN